MKPLLKLAFFGTVALAAASGITIAKRDNLAKDNAQTSVLDKTSPAKTDVAVKGIVGTCGPVAPRLLAEIGEFDNAVQQMKALIRETNAIAEILERNGDASERIVDTEPLVKPMRALFRETRNNLAATLELAMPYCPNFAKFTRQAVATAFQDGNAHFDRAYGRIGAIARRAKPAAASPVTTARSTFPNGRTLVGFVDHVRDGDTIVVNGHPLRLNGIDAPELGSAEGRRARAAIIGIIGGQQLSCRLDGTRTHDRVVGVCTTPDGRDIGAELVKSGFALDCRRYSGGRYATLEASGARQRLPQARYC